MAVHPKISVLGALLLGAVAGGLLLFLLGRVTAGVSLAELLIGVGLGLFIVGAVTIGLARHLPASKRMAGLLLQDATTSESGFVSAEPRRDLVGKTGLTLSELRPVGIAQIDGERVDVTTEGEFVHANIPVTVVRAEGMRVVVRPDRPLNA